MLATSRIRARIAGVAALALAAGLGPITPNAADAAPVSGSVTSVTVTGKTPTTVTFTVTWSNGNANKGFCYTTWTGNAPGSYSWKASSAAQAATSPRTASETLTNGVDGVVLTAGVYNTVAIIDAATGTNGVVATCPTSSNSPRAATTVFVPEDTPSEPQNVTALGGIREVLLSWEWPDSEGMLPIDSFEASDGNGHTCTVSASADNPTSCWVTALDNGTSYTFTVTAINGNGTGRASAPATATTLDVPGAPQNATAIAGDGQVTVTWDAPGSDGGSSITGYTVTSKPDGVTCTSVYVNSCTVTGLTNGTTYTFTVTATNAVGTSPASDITAQVTPEAPPQLYVPDAPYEVAATAGDGEATVTWTAPDSDGGDAIVSYTVTSTPGGETCTAYAPDTTCTVTGLENTRRYTFTVVATNGVGDSDPSDPSNEVFPHNDEFQVFAGSSTVAVGACTTVYVFNAEPGKAVLLRIGGQRTTVEADEFGSATYDWCAEPSLGNRVLIGRKLMLRVAYRMDRTTVVAAASAIYIPKLVMRTKFREGRLIQATYRAVAEGSLVQFVMTDSDGNTGPVCEFTADSTGTGICSGEAPMAGDYHIDLVVDGVVVAGNDFTVIARPGSQQ